jgi:hypothetical protein
MNSHEQFFKEQYIPLLQKLTGKEVGTWGVLSPQGMIEHMTDSIGIAHGRIKEELQTPTEVLERVRTFALSDKEFKPDTKNSLMSETPAALRFANISEAIVELREEINLFFNYYKENPEQTVLNPFFGDFNYEEWLHLLHKHAIHHLKQFNLV